MDISRTELEHFLSALANMQTMLRSPHFQQQFHLFFEEFHRFHERFLRFCETVKEKQPA